MILPAWPREAVARLEVPSWETTRPVHLVGPCDRTAVVELTDGDDGDRSVVVASWCGGEGPLPTTVALIDGLLAGRLAPDRTADWTGFRVGRVAVLRGDPFGSAGDARTPDAEPAD